MTGDQDEDRLWYVLLGACLANKQTRLECKAALLPEDAPPHLRELWEGVMEGRRATVSAKMEAWGCGQGKVLNGAMRELQRKAMNRYCKNTVRSMEFSTILLPDQVLDMLERSASDIKARKLALEKTGDLTVEEPKEGS